MTLKLVIRFLAFALIVVSPFTASADNGTLKVQMARVKNLMAGGDYYGAIRVLRELEKSNPNNDAVFYRSGQCHYQLKNYEDALIALEKSAQLDENSNLDKYYYLGLTFQIKGKLEESKQAFNKYLEKETKDKTKIEISKNKIKQIDFASELIKKPIKVTIKNLGEDVNTEYPEYNPSISADGNVLIFTSRRPDTEGGMKDENDNKFLEDIYIAYRDSISGKWQQAERVPGNLNTDNHDANTSISPDGKTIFIYRNMGYKGSGQIYFSKQNNAGKWGAAKPLEGDVNTSYFESSACLTPDGKYMYFVSERKGGKGMGDIYRAKGKKTTFNNAENLGSPVNTDDDEIGIFIHPDGKTIYFSSNGHESMGGYDIFKSTLEKGKWSKPENLGYPINTPGDERFFVLSTDGTKAYYTSTGQDGLGDLDIFEIDFSAMIQEDEQVKTFTGPPISLLNGKIVDNSASQVNDCEITVTEKQTKEQFTTSSDEDGAFFMSLEANKTYELIIKKQGYQSHTEEFLLKAGNNGTFTLNRVVVLKKEN